MTVKSTKAKSKSRPEGFTQIEVVPSNILFPSPEIIERLTLLPQANTQPTTLKKLNPIQIAEQSKVSPISIVLSKGMSRKEKRNIREAARQVGSQITIYEGGKTQKQETKIMREIDKEFLQNEDAKKIFTHFLEIMTRTPEELFVTEYKDFILGHEETSQIIDPLNTHYLSNLGLRQIKDDKDGNKDPLRAEMVKFAQEALKTVKPLFGALIHDFPHNHLNIDDAELVLMLGILSNFLRGGIFYGYRSKSMKYPPRTIAFNLINYAREDKLQRK